MGSGEADAYEVKVKAMSDTLVNGSYPTVGNITWPNYTGDYWGTSSTISWTYTNMIYMYQLTCPKPRCKQTNWCELDKTVICRKCGSTLKAVSEVVDYEIPVK